MYTIDKNFVDARYASWAYQHGAPTMADHVQPGQVIKTYDIRAFDDSSHDEDLFKKHLIGKRADEAYEAFKGFQGQLKNDALRSATEEEFRKGFLWES